MENRDESRKPYALRNGVCIRTKIKFVLKEISEDESVIVPEKHLVVQKRGREIYGRRHIEFQSSQWGEVSDLANSRYSRGVNVPIPGCDMVKKFLRDGRPFYFPCNCEYCKSCIVETNRENFEAIAGPSDVVYIPPSQRQTAEKKVSKPASSKLHRSQSQADDKIDSEVPGWDCKRTVHLPYLSKKTSQGEVEAYYSKFGPVSDSYIPQDPETHISKGFGSVLFVHESDAKKAIAALEGALEGTKAEDTKDEGGNALKHCMTLEKDKAQSSAVCPIKAIAKFSNVEPPDSAKVANRRPSQRQHKKGSGMSIWTDENSVRVNNLAEDTGEADLQACFGIYGPVSRVCIAYDQMTKMSQGFGVVKFVHKYDAEKAIAKHNGTVEWAAPRAPEV